MTRQLPAPATRPAGLALQLAALIELLTGSQLPVRLRAYDGSEAGPDGGLAVQISSPTALRRIAWSPGELGIADAYVAGDIMVDGDLMSLLRLLAATRQQHDGAAGRRLPSAAALARAAWLGLSAGAVGLRPAPPAPRARVGGRMHSRARDSAVIAHHYDLSNEFYELLLDPAMCYSCGYWTSEEPGYGLADAQRDKLDLVCGKLGLQPGMRLLDMGCGWGSLVHHAAAHYGAIVTGVTLSAQQAEYARRRVAAAGLDGRAEIRLADYRDINGETYDAIASIEMGEHVGESGYPAFAARLAGLLGPGARLLIQQMSRASVPDGGPFIASYIAPDMHLRPLSRTLTLLEHAGLEVLSVQGMREHYARTFQAWRETLDARFGEAAGLLGVQAARVWRLFLAGGGLAFELGTTGVDQIVAAKAPGPRGSTGVARAAAGLPAGPPAASVPPTPSRAFPAP
jgi:cyclopropane-fatty-acyl-phospholipid synthase